MSGYQPRLDGDAVGVVDNDLPVRLRARQPVVGLEQGGEELYRVDEADDEGPVPARAADMIAGSSGTKSCGCRWDGLLICLYTRYLRMMKLDFETKLSRRKSGTRKRN